GRRAPGTARLAEPTVMGTTCDVLGARVTEAVPSVAAIAAAPPTLRSKVSCTCPVFFTVIWNVPPGAVLGGVSPTVTPFRAIVRVPVACAEAPPLAAVTVNGCVERAVAGARGT